MKWNLRYEFEDLGTLHCVWRRKHKKTSSKIWLRSSECGRPSGLSTCWKVRNNYRPHLYIPIESSHQVSMVILLDPRSLLPMDVNVEKAFEDSGKLLGCAFSLAGTGDGVALFRGEIPLRHYVMLEKILLGSFHVSQSIFWIILILEDPCMRSSESMSESIDTCCPWDFQLENSWTTGLTESLALLCQTLPGNGSAKVPGSSWAAMPMFERCQFQCLLRVSMKMKVPFGWNLPPK